LFKATLTHSTQLCIIPDSVANLVRKKRRRSWATCGLAAFAHTRVLRYTRRAHNRPKLALFLRIPLAREPKFATRLHAAQLPSLVSYPKIKNNMLYK